MSYAGNDPQQKIDTAKTKKEEADAAFKKGDLQTGQLHSFAIARLETVVTRLTTPIYSSVEVPRGSYRFPVV